MANMYFAKVNVNSDIYEVYNNPNKLGEILFQLMDVDWQYKQIEESVRNKVTKEIELVTYKFVNIDKFIDDNYIVGRLIVIFKDDLSLYDDKKDDLISLSQSQLSRSVPFYLDLSKEIVAFVPTQKFNRKKFIKYFEELINVVYGKPMFSVFAKSNLINLQFQINTFDKISEVDINIIPPNSNDSEFDELFAKNGDELKETKGTKFNQKISAPHSKEGLNIHAGLFQRIITGVAKGFGNITISGKDNSGEPKTICSDVDSPYRKYINNRYRESLNAVANYGRAGISAILSSEVRQRINKNE